MPGQLGWEIAEARQVHDGRCGGVGLLRADSAMRHRQCGGIAGGGETRPSVFSTGQWESAWENRRSRGR